MLARLAACTALGLGASCGGDVPPPDLIRLARDLQPVEHVLAGASMQARLPGNRPQRFEELDWFLLSDGGGAERWPLLPLALDEGAIRLARDAGIAAVAWVPVLPGEALSVRLGLRASGEFPEQDVPLASVVELREPLDPAEGLVARDIPYLFDPGRSAMHVLQGPLRRRTETLRSDFVAASTTRAVAVYVLTPQQDATREVIVDALDVVRVPVGRLVAEGGDFPRLERVGDHGAVRLYLDRDERDGVLALPGSRSVFRLPDDGRARRLDFSLGVAPRSEELHGALRVRVQADGQTLFDTLCRAPTDPEQPAWSDQVVELPVGARRLVLSAEGEGDDPPLVVWGHPVVRARVAAPKRPNIVLISLDTLRADHLGCYGGPPGLSPRLDVLADEGLLFANAYSTSSYTLPSHGSMLTGQYPALHGAVDISDVLDPDRSPFLARALAREGYVTAAFTGGGYVATAYGFGPGFDRYSHNDPVWAVDGVRGRQLIETVSWELLPVQLPLLRRYATPMVTDWLEQQTDGVPFFAFLHTYVVHNFAPDRRRLEEHGLLGADGEEEPFDHRDRALYNVGKLPDSAEVRARITEQYVPYYDATIAMADEFVGAVLDALERAGVAENTMVIVTSDHGEEFGEHAFFGHGESLYEANVRIPMIVRMPAGPDGARPQGVIEQPISLVDLAPWILRTAGATPDPRMSARPPLGADTLDPPGRSTVVTELDTRVNRLSAVREGSLKLHLLHEGALRGLAEGVGSVSFDLGVDPDEQHPLAGEPPAAVDFRELIGWLHSAAEALGPSSSGSPDLAHMDPEVREMLEQLGYLDGQREDEPPPAGQGDAPGGAPDGG
ncbi:MAG: sulfatase-like hydrolase/transferase [Planctomycetota bacterium]